VTELIKSLINVRDALSLIAFLSLVLLIAFRTQKVPELFFGVVRDKLTRQQFAELLRRFMILGFAAFVILVILAITAQILSREAKPNALTIEDLRNELAKSSASEDTRIHAEATYKLAMDNASKHDLDAAIASLKQSIAAVPTLTAQEMLTYLYRAKHDLPAEAASWEAAMKLARREGDTIAQVRLDRETVPPGLPEAGEHDLIGQSAALPKGGAKYETATKISPGFYACTDTQGCFAWYSLYLNMGQNLKVHFRSPPNGGLCGIQIFGTNGEFLGGAGDGPGTMRGNAGAASTIYNTEWTAIAGGWHYLRTISDPGAVYRILIR